MTASWMVYAVVLSLLLGGAGSAIEAGLRALGRPGRWGVLAGLVASAALPAVALAIHSASPDSAVWAGGPWKGSVVPYPLPDPSASSHLDSILLGLWGLGSVLLLLLAWLGHLRTTRRVLLCATDHIQGTEVRRTRELGPAVVGVVRAVIVFPQWARALEPRDQCLALIHEEEHLRARDPLLLFGSFILAALQPWNPALWWQVSRLKEATERDCDRRVLARGADPRAYAALLLRLASPRRWNPPFALAIQRVGTRVGRRIVEMAEGLAGARPLRALLYSGLALGLFALSLEIPPPPTLPSTPPVGALPQRSEASSPGVPSSSGPWTASNPGPLRFQGTDAKRILLALGEGLGRTQEAPASMEIPLEGGAVFIVETRDHPPGATLTLARPDPSPGSRRLRQVSLDVEVVEGEPVLTFKEI